MFQKFYLQVGMSTEKRGETVLQVLGTVSFKNMYTFSEIQTLIKEK